MRVLLSAVLALSLAGCSHPPVEPVPEPEPEAGVGDAVVGAGARAARGQLSETTTGVSGR